MARCCPRGGLCEERPGLPHAEHRWFQPAAVGPPQGTAGPRSQDGGAWAKMGFERTENTALAVRNGPADSQGRAGGEKALRVPEQTVPCSPCGDRSGAGGYFLKELQLAAGQGQPTAMSHNR